jgi:glycosyltransferase involved in cell wall biosynthesis
MRRADVAVAVCQAACRRFVGTGAFAPAKAVVVLNAADVARAPARDAAARERLLLSLGRPSHAMVVGAVGRLNAIKNHALLLRAAQLVRQRGQALEVVIVGDGPERAALQSMASALQIGDCVHLVGWRDDVASLLAGFDVLAMPSRSEGYSLALVEAAAAALPLVATAVGGNPEIVQPGKTGLLVPDDDALALADALARLASDVGLRERLGDAARQWALAHADLDAMGHAYAALYEHRP